MRKLLRRFFIALSMFTVLPVPPVEWEEGGGAAATAFWPLTGLLLGGLWTGLAALCLRFRLPPALSAVALAALPMVFSGGLHMDGFMDVCDAALSRRERPERLRILKDPHTGSFAVLGALLLFLWDWGAAAALLETGRAAAASALLFIPSAGRAAAGLLLLRLPLLPGSGLGAYFRKNARRGHHIALWAALAAAVPAAAALGWLSGGGVRDFAGPAGVLAALVMTVLAGGGAARNLGGVNGDVTGFALSLGEAAGLTAAALWAYLL